MTIDTGRLNIAAPAGGRCAVAFTVAIADAAAVLACFRFNVLGVFNGGDGLSCGSLGLTQRASHALEGNAILGLLLLPGIIIPVIIALGLYDPRPLIARLEQSRRPHWWLAVNAAGAVIFVSPYLLAAAGVPSSSFAPLAPYLLILGAPMTAAGLLLWLSDGDQLAGSLQPHHALVVLAALLGLFAANELQLLGWSIPVLQTATIKMTIFFLKLIGQAVISDPGQSMIGVNNFKVNVGPPCSGIAGIVMVSAVMAGYILVLRQRLEITRALLLVPLAALLSFLFNGVRIAALLMIGAYVSPDLSVNAFHTYAGWLAFCALSVLMLLAAENIGWIHRRGRPAASVVPVLNDPVIARIAPFIILLLSSMLASAAFVNPESGYPLRAALMAAAVLLFWKAYRPEIRAVDAVPFLAGALAAAVWLGVKAGGSPLSLATILGPVSPGAAALWVLCRIGGTVLLVPFIEELFFRGYLLPRLDFGGAAGKAAALVLS